MNKFAQFGTELARDFAAHFPRSGQRVAARQPPLLDHVSHAVRWCDPFMVSVQRCAGAVAVDLDGHEHIDYWQGHFANILGHNPPLIREALQRTLAAGQGLQSGLLHEIEAEVAELLCRQTAMETLRFTTSGTLCTFYAMLMARSFTGRPLMVKVQGGWHGSQPFALKGVGDNDGPQGLASEGLPASLDAEIIVVPFNDPEALQQEFARRGEQIACFVVEPWLGAGGAIAANLDYLREARRLTEHHGALMICDETITGFRFRAGDASSLYGIHPDLMILGKIIGGGMPVAAVLGRREVMATCSRAVERTKFEGGTFSAHELSLVASRTMLRHLVDHEKSLYDALGNAGALLRAGLREALQRHGLPAKVAGDPAPGCEAFGSSLAMVHTPIPEGLWRAVLLLQGVSTHHGLGALSTEHTDEHRQRTLQAYDQACDRIAAAGLVDCLA